MYSPKIFTYTKTTQYRFFTHKNHQNCADCQYIKIDSKVIFSIQSNIYLTVKQQHTNIKRIIFIYKWGYR